jgi:hypothetical protein
MHLAPHHAVRRVAVRAGLLALLVGVSLSLTQCVQVTDPISGSTAATFAHGRTSDCFFQCAKDYAKGLQDELELYLHNRKACRKDPVCLALERCRHEKALDQLKDDFRNCRKGCHHQGRGDDGDNHDH